MDSSTRMDKLKPDMSNLLVWTVRMKARLMGKGLWYGVVHPQQRRDQFTPPPLPMSSTRSQYIPRPPPMNEYVESPRRFTKEREYSPQQFDLEEPVVKSEMGSSQDKHRPRPIQQTPKSDMMTRGRFERLNGRAVDMILSACTKPVQMCLIEFICKQDVVGTQTKTNRNRCARPWCSTQEHSHRTIRNIW